MLDHDALALETAGRINYRIEQGFRYDFDAPVQALRQRRGSGTSLAGRSLDDAHRRCLQTLATLRHLEFDPLLVGEAMVVAVLDLGAVNEEVRTAPVAEMSPKPLAALNHLTVPAPHTLP